MNFDDKKVPEETQDIYNRVVNLRKADLRKIGFSETQIGRLVLLRDYYKPACYKPKFQKSSIRDTFRALLRGKSRTMVDLSMCLSFAYGCPCFLSSPKV